MAPRANCRFCQVYMGKRQQGGQICSRYIYNWKQGQNVHSSDAIDLSQASKGQTNRHLDNNTNLKMY